MTPAEYREALETLAWTPGALSRVLGCHRNLCLQWGTGRAQVPAPVAAWLAGLARAHRALTVPDWRTRSAA